MMVLENSLNNENFKKEFTNLIQNYDKIKKTYEDLIQNLCIGFFNLNT